MGVVASYLIHSETGERDQMDWTPEFSRRARGFTVYAALRSLGRSGVAELVERSCAHARRFAELLSAEPELEVLNEVVLEPGARPRPRRRTATTRTRRRSPACRRRASRG